MKYDITLTKLFIPELEITSFDSSRISQIALVISELEKNDIY
jgi:hypothetical protein